ncbi:hypothetical protein QTO05_16035 [Vibrio fortis]|uniref:hypothetical protein n=1 Tax=Vibrio fortis TaxID=212667 RepID=UPI002F40E72A
MYKYLLPVALFLSGCASTNETAEQSWCESYNAKLTAVFSNETTLGARTLDTVIGCAPRPLPAYVKGSTLEQSPLISTGQAQMVAKIKDEYKGLKPSAESIVNFAVSKEAKQLALSRALRLNELSYSIIAQSQKEKSELIKNNTFVMLNTFTKENLQRLSDAAETSEEQYDRYQKKVHRIQREYYDILYQITLGGADKDGRQSIAYDPKDIASLLIKVVKVYADQQALRSNFLLMRDQYFASAKENVIPDFDSKWLEQINDIKDQCKLTAEALSLDKTSVLQCENLDKQSDGNG